MNKKHLRLVTWEHEGKIVALYEQGISLRHIRPQDFKDMTRIGWMSRTKATELAQALNAEFMEV